MKMAMGGNPSTKGSGGFVAGQSGRSWCGRAAPGPLLIEIGWATVLLAGWCPPAPYKKKSPALLGPRIPDPNTHGAFFSFRLRQPLQVSASYLQRIVFGNLQFQTALSDVIAPRLALPCLTLTRTAYGAFLVSCLATTSLAFALVVSVDLTDAFLF